MRKTARQKVVIIGCGNVAWHLTKQLGSSGKFIIHVYNHKQNASLKKFKRVLHCFVLPDFSAIIPDADYYFVSVSDQHVEKTAAALPDLKKSALLMHTSGSLPLEVLSKAHHQTAVFYPLQSFSKERDLDWAKIPVFLEGSNRSAEKKVKTLANHFSKKQYTVNYKARLSMHLSAVFVNNFVNALYVVAEDLLSKGTTKTIPAFSSLFPIIEETGQKLLRMHALEAQTGPAKRGDTVVMKKHLELLGENKRLTELYKQLSGLISSQQKKKNAEF